MVALRYLRPSYVSRYYGSSVSRNSKNGHISCCRTDGQTENTKARNKLVRKLIPFLLLVAGSHRGDTCNTCRLQRGISDLAGLPREQQP